MQIQVLSVLMILQKPGHMILFVCSFLFQMFLLLSWGENDQLIYMKKMIHRKAEEEVVTLNQMSPS